jgi:hypothetical protein
MKHGDYKRFLELEEELIKAADVACGILFHIYKEAGVKTVSDRYTSYNKVPENGGWIEEFNSKGVRISWYHGDQPLCATIPIKFIYEETRDHAADDLRAELKPMADEVEAKRKADRERNAANKEAEDRALYEELKKRFEEQ